jgi:hypothetical protein
MVQSQLTKLSSPQEEAPPPFPLPRLIHQWIWLLFHRLANGDRCNISTIIGHFRRLDADFLTIQQRKMYVDEGVLMLDDDMRWVTFDQFIELLKQRIELNGATRLSDPTPPSITRQQLITWRVPSTREILPLFPARYSLARGEGGEQTAPYKSHLQQNLHKVERLAAQLSQNYDDSVCERIEAMMLESASQKRSPLSTSDSDDEEEGMEVVGSENIKEKLLASRRRPLTTEEETTVAAALSSPHNGTILCEKFKIPMTRAKMSCLRPTTWLNDEVINFYLEMLAERDTLLCERSNGTRKASHYFNTFFITKLLENGQFTYSNVRRYSAVFFSLVCVDHSSLLWSLSQMDSQDQSLRERESVLSNQHRQLPLDSGRGVCAAEASSLFRLNGGSG